MAFEGRLTVRGRAETGPASPYEPRVRAIVDLDEAYTDTSARSYYAALSGGAGSTTALDLTTITDAFGTPLAATAVYTLIVSAPAANTGAVTLSPSASNGWTGLLADASDIVKIPAGSRFVADSDSGYAVSASSKAIDLANATGSAQSVTVYIVVKTT